jgi:hypothetical protein
MTYHCEATPTAAILPAPRCSRATASASAADSADQPPAGRAAKRLVILDFINNFTTGVRETLQKQK